MYAQSYQDEGIRGIPDTYSGVALRENQNDDGNNSDTDDIPVSKNPWENECEAKEEQKHSSNILSDIFASIISPLGFGRGAQGFKIGTEELLIIGAAAFLFFSKERDIECIIMLVALLLIT